MDSHVLNDGRVIATRPIRADDGDRLQAAHEQLSDESRYRRFLHTKPRLSGAEIRYLVGVDGSQHFALVATCPDAGEGSADAIVAVARFIRLDEHDDVAEFAVVVSDEYQGQGLAGELMQRLAAAAIERGVRRFRASMLADNVAVRRIMQNLAAGPVRVLGRGAVLELEIELADPSPAVERVPAMIAGCPGS